MRQAEAVRGIPLAPAEEGERVMRICNACRYCEGFCAVFPAVERRLAFTAGDLSFLAQLCHDCRACYDACQYASPHPFAVDVPRTLAAIRHESYAECAWPGRLASSLFSRQGLMLLLAAVAAPLVALGILAALVEPGVLLGAHADADGAFYRVVPHIVMVTVFGVLGLATAGALVAGPIRFWRGTGTPVGSFWNLRAHGRALADALALRHLRGGGDGCTYPHETPSHTRRWLHQVTFHGFVLCFAATTVAAVYHNVLGWPAPYPRLSLPVVLGTVGGAGLVVGPVGLLWLKIVRRREAEVPAQAWMDVVFLVLLLLTSVTGLLLLAFRESSAMGVLLAVHLGVVAGLFVAMPFGKFVHGLYRYCALVRNALEEKTGA